MIFTSRLEGELLGGAAFNMIGEEAAGVRGWVLTDGDVAVALGMRISVVVGGTVTADLTSWSAAGRARFVLGSFACSLVAVVMIIGAHVVGSVVSTASCCCTGWLAGAGCIFGVVLGAILGEIFLKLPDTEVLLLADDWLSTGSSFTGLIAMVRFVELLDERVGFTVVCGGIVVGKSWFGVTVCWSCMEFSMRSMLSSNASVSWSSSASLLARLESSRVAVASSSCGDDDDELEHGDADEPAESSDNMRSFSTNTSLSSSFKSALWQASPRS